MATAAPQAGLSPGTRVEAYWNLHKACVSYREPGGPARHAAVVKLRDVRFVVQPAGQAKVRRERRKNVHAYARGILMAVDGLVPADTIEITYDPYAHATFVTVSGGEPVTRADRAWIARKRVWLPRAV